MNKYEEGYRQGKLDAQEAIESFGREWKVPNWRNLVDVINTAPIPKAVKKHFDVVEGDK